MSFTAAVQSLLDEGVEFVLIGGWAAIAHGSAYTTQDLESCFTRSSENLKRLARFTPPAS